MAEEIDPSTQVFRGLSESGAVVLEALQHHAEYQRLRWRDVRRSITFAVGPILLVVFIGMLALGQPNASPTVVVALGLALSVQSTAFFLIFAYNFDRAEARELRLIRAQIEERVRLQSREERHDGGPESR